MDWNVFFSTISQTSGAIVGIFAAFLITKIISNQSDFSKLKNEATHHLIDSETAESEAKTRYFDWYNKAKRNEAIAKIEYEALSKRQIPQANECILKFKFSPFDDLDQVKVIIEDKLSELSDNLEAERKRNETMKSMFGSTFSLPSILPTPPLVNLNNNLGEEREMIDQLIIKIERQAKKNEALCAELKSGVDSVNLVTSSIVAVLILFFVGVIYPLSFLPWQQGKDITLSLSAFWDILFSLQGFMLLLISVIFSALMMVFLVINMKLKHSIDVIDKITHYSDISNYSPHLANYKKNKVG
ncbi:hypothetical protein LOS88_10360 [Aeromonas veronii]|uniref:hypothetical protein n=1 Tax=Aeromonas veronii TaxID=654 RepID=UPI001FD0614B|nr:hypothetical protein [Aeromonas veronii]MCJ7977916.1 hypothetical protein [Aeromonas veronii]UOR20997.1 hypothetical protein LOS88_10360 [Aeromonas veronii]